MTSDKSLKKVPRLKERFKKEVIPLLMTEFSYKNLMEVPGIEKIIVNAGVGEAVQNAKVLDVVATEIRQISGQSPVITKAKKSIAGFKLRAGMPVGCKVTLRGNKMYEFLDKLVSVSLPRIRDFRGVSGKSFDGHGNYTLGIKEQIIFPEIKYESVSFIHGFDITIVTSATTDEEGKALLRFIGMPFRN